MTHETSAVNGNCWKCGRELGSLVYMTVDRRSFHGECYDATFSPAKASVSPAIEPVAWLGEGDGFKSFTRREAVANSWTKRGLKVTQVVTATSAEADIAKLREGLEAIKEARMPGEARRLAAALLKGGA